MAKGRSHTQRTLHELREREYTVGIVERFNQHAGPFGVRQDLFGFIDIIAIDLANQRVIGVQSCPRNGRAAHERTILARPEAKLWLQAGQAIELWSWAKQVKKRGSKQMVWKVRVDHITLDMFDDYTPIDTGFHNNEDDDLKI